jgi:hypothetical protein
VREKEKNESTPELTWTFVYVYDPMVYTRIHVSKWEGTSQRKEQLGLEDHMDVGSTYGM